MVYCVVGNEDSGRLGTNYVCQSWIWWEELYRKSSEENIRANENVCKEGKELDKLSQVQYINFVRNCQFSYYLQVTYEFSFKFRYLGMTLDESVDSLTMDACFSFL